MKNKIFNWITVKKIKFVAFVRFIMRGEFTMGMLDDQKRYYSLLVDGHALYMVQDADYSVKSAVRHYNIRMKMSTTDALSGYAKPLKYEKVLRPGLHFDPRGWVENEIAAKAIDESIRDHFPYAHLLRGTACAESAPAASLSIDDLVELHNELESKKPKIIYNAPEGTIPVPVQTLKEFGGFRVELDPHMPENAMVLIAEGKHIYYLNMDVMKGYWMDTVDIDTAMSIRKPMEDEK